MARRSLSAHTVLLAAALLMLCACGNGSPEDHDGAPSQDEHAIAPDRPDDRNQSTAIDETQAQFDASGQRWVGVERGTVELNVPTVGSFRARRTSRVSTQVSGRVDEIHVDVGDRVQKGDVLLNLDTSFFEIERAQTQAELEGARVALADAELAYKRLADLWSEGEDSAIPEQMLDEAKAQRDRAKAALRQAREALRYAEQRLEEAVVTAPYDGTITEKMVDPGELVTNTPVVPLLEIQETGVLELLFTLPQDSLAMVRPGTELKFEIDGIPGRRFNATVDRVYPTIDEATRSFRSRAWIDNADHLIRPGMLAQVWVVAGRRKDVLKVPRRALSKTADGWAVSVESEGVPEVRPVEVGLMGVEEAEIKSGLTEDDRVLLLDGNA